MELGIGDFVGPVVGLLGGGFLGTAGKAWADQRRLSGEQKLAEAQQPIEQYQEIVTDLRARVILVETKLENCMREHAESRFEVGRLNGRLDEQRESMNHLRTTTTKQAAEAVKVAGTVAADAVKTAAAMVGKSSDSGILSSVDKEHPLPVTVIAE